MSEGVISSAWPGKAFHVHLLNACDAVSELFHQATVSKLACKVGRQWFQKCPDGSCLEPERKAVPGDIAVSSVLPRSKGLDIPAPVLRCPISVTVAAVRPPYVASPCRERKDSPNRSRTCGSGDELSHTQQRDNVWYNLPTSVNYTQNRWKCWLPKPGIHESEIVHGGFTYLGAP